MTHAIGIEIGGTKLQAGAGLRDGKPMGTARATVDPAGGAEGIRRAIPTLVEEAMGTAGLAWDAVSGVGVGFGGPVDSRTGAALTSHQIEGWRGFPLKQWLTGLWDRPAAVENDASLAGFAEARMGAGRGFQRVLYVTIGSGIGGGWIVDGKIDGGQGLGAAEIGHTWVPDPDTGEPEKLELVCSGWSIGRRARAALEEGEPSALRAMFDEAGPESVTAREVHEAAEAGDLLALALLNDTCSALALGLCNAIALLHPERIILGGGVSMMGPLFWEPLREKVNQYAFEPFQGTFEIVPAALGEDVVVCGALLLGMEAGAANP